MIREPLEIIYTPKHAWEIVGTDLYTHERRKYIIVVDYYSRYFETMLLRSEKSIDTINALKSIFARHGIPETVVSDNGSQYISQEFKEFQEKYGFQAITYLIRSSLLGNLQHVLSIYPFLSSQLVIPRLIDIQRSSIFHQLIDIC